MCGRHPSLDALHWNPSGRLNRKCRLSPSVFSCTGMGQSCPAPTWGAVPQAGLCLPGPCSRRNRVRTASSSTTPAATALFPLRGRRVGIGLTVGIGRCATTLVDRGHPIALLVNHADGLRKPERIGLRPDIHDTPLLRTAGHL